MGRILRRNFNMNTITITFEGNTVTVTDGRHTEKGQIFVCNVTGELSL